MGSVDRFSERIHHAATSTAVLAPRTIAFVRGGEFWTIGEERAPFTVRDAKGLNYLLTLLQHPGEEFHAFDILGVSASAETSPAASDILAERSDVTVRDLGDSGEMLDEQAKLEYRRRLRELNVELEELRERGDAVRAAKVESEVDFLTRERLRATGLGGRSRRSGSSAERARLNVTRAIRFAIGKIGEYDASLGQALSRTIVTGTYCSYVPDSRTPVNFKLSPSASVSPSVAGAAAGIVASSPPAVSGSPSFEQILAGRTPFVGRERESAALDRIFEGVQQGMDRVVLLSGPAGVGKSRLATEFCAKAIRHGMSAVSGGCDERKDAPAFLPFLEVIEAALVQAPTPADFRRLLGDDAAEIARLMPSLRRTFPDIPPSEDVAPEEARRFLLAALVAVINRAARIRPLVLLVEDLQWADAESLSVIQGIAKSFAHSRIMVIGTMRGHGLDASSPLARLLEQLSRLHVLEQISVPGLSEAASSRMVDDLARRHVAPAVRRFMYSSTEGNPLFIEELFQHLVERGELNLESGNFKTGFGPEAAELPKSLRLVIERRLAALSEGTRKVVGTCAVVGRSFTFDLLEKVAAIDPELVLDALEEAERAGLVFSTLESHEANFQFSHVLIRQVILASVLAPRRQRLHLRVADAIEQLYPAALDDHANDIAHHLLEAGSANTDSARTVRYLAIAARREISKSGYESALGHLMTAREMIPRLTPGTERDHIELDLLIDHGVTLLVLKGFYVPQLGEIYQRAAALCKTLGENGRLVSVLYGLSTLHLCRAELKRARGYVEEMRLLPRSSDDAIAILSGWLMGDTQFFMGELAAAHHEFEQVIARYDKSIHRNLAMKAGQDLGVSCLAYDAMTLLLMGFPDEAEKRLASAIALARELNHPFTLVLCLTTAAMYRCIRRDFHQVPELVRETTTVAHEYGFTFYAETITAYDIISVAAEGTLEQLKAALSRTPRFSEIRYELANTWARSALAESMANFGRVKSAASLLNEATEMMIRNDERIVESEIRRIGGVLLLKQLAAGTPSDEEIAKARDAAERAFRDAYEIALRQGAKLFTLRAAISTAKLLSDTPRRHEGEAMLDQCLSSFTEGFDSRELIEARTLLGHCHAAT